MLMATMLRARAEHFPDHLDGAIELLVPFAVWVGFDNRIWLDPTLNRFAGRRQINRRGQAQRVVAAQWDQSLYGSFAEAPLAH